MSVATPAELKSLQTNFSTAVFVVSFVDDGEQSSYLKVRA